MNTWIKTIIILAGVVLVAGSCKKDDEFEYFVHSSLQQYFDRFVAEGASRGVILDFEALKISGHIRVITTQQVIGQCAHNDDEPNTVIIDKLYWDSANDMEREFLVFHELGHCALNRGHLDSADNRGDCISIMTSGTGICRINYNVANRQDLLDELFMP